MNDLNWSTLPPHIVVEIYSYLRPNDRLILSQVCKEWSKCFHDAMLWSCFSFNFDTKFDDEARSLVCADKYSEELQDVTISINQTQPKSLERALYVLDKIIDLEIWKLSHLKLEFTAQNPLCFNGKKVLDKVETLLRSIEKKEVAFPLLKIDLSGLDLCLWDSMLNILSKSHNSLKVVHIQNLCLVDNITSNGVLELVNACEDLEELYVFYHCLDDDVITALSNGDRTPLKILSVMCNRSDKYQGMVSSNSWELLKNASPDLQLIIKCHSTMPRQLVIPLLCRGIPATHIDLHLYSWVNREVSHIAETCTSSLVYFSCHTSLDPNSHGNAELLPALIELATKCKKLEELHCHCRVPEETVNSILSKTSLKKYTLYSERITE